MAPPSPVLPAGDHQAHLDALRGLAALMVAVSHAFIALKLAGVDRLWEVPLWQVGPWEALLGKLVVTVSNPALAVSLFFVLSGVVLGQSLDRDGGLTGRTYGAFLLRRALRIYPAHLVALSAIVAALLLLHPEAWTPGEAASGWLARYFRVAPDAAAMGQNAGLIATHLNPVTWTLQVEVAVACVFPWLHGLSRWGGAGLAGQAGLAGALLAVGLFRPTSVWLPHLYEFYLGLLAPALAGGGLAGAAWRRSACRWALAVALPLALTAPQWSSLDRLNHVLIGLSAFLLLTLALDPATPRWWDTAPTRALGRWSYGFYLWHFPVLWFGCFLLLRHDVGGLASRPASLPVVAALCLGSVALTLPLAWLSHRLVERPAIALGRRLTRRGAGGAPER